MIAEPAASGSPRITLAETAAQAVADLAGVHLVPGPDFWQTVGGGRRVRGITSVAQGDGAFELTIHIAVEWPPKALATVADELRRRITAAIEQAGLGEALGAVDVHVVTVDEPPADQLS